jgi:DNA-binding NarL/FixJ family response regulator
VTAKRPRIILADDHHLLVEGLRQLLSPRFDVVAVVYDGEALLATLRRTSADALLLDLGLPGRSGLDLLPDIRALRPTMKVLVVTMHLDRVLADAAIAGGADGFVPKDAGAEELQVALHEVLAGRRFVSRLVPKSSHRVGLGARHMGLARLTPRQQEIVRMIGEGRSTAEIAAALGLRPSTVAFHRANMRKALGIPTEWGLVRFAILTRVGETEAAERDRS